MCHIDVDMSTSGTGQRALQTLRHWSVRHASALKRFYDAFARFAPYLSRPLRWAGTRSMERVLRPLERASKQLLFDCKMCGQCVLSSTGMACPRNCAKLMRNGPCGGVRADGTCEVNAAMRCVWVEATDGLKRIGPPQSKMFLEPIDHRLWNSSSWLRVIDAHILRRPVYTAPAEAFSFKTGRTVRTIHRDRRGLARLFRSRRRIARIRASRSGRCHHTTAPTNCHVERRRRRDHGRQWITPVAQFSYRERYRLQGGKYSGRTRWACAIFFALPARTSDKATIPCCRCSISIDLAAAITGHARRRQPASGRKLASHRTVTQRFADRSSRPIATTSPI